MGLKNAGIQRDNLKTPISEYTRGTSCTGEEDKRPARWLGVTRISCNPCCRRGLLDVRAESLDPHLSALLDTHHPVLFGMDIELSVTTPSASKDNFRGYVRFQKCGGYRQLALCTQITSRKHGQPTYLPTYKLGTPLGFFLMRVFLLEGCGNVPETPEPLAKMGSHDTGVRRDDLPYGTLGKFYGRSMRGSVVYEARGVLPSLDPCLDPWSLRG